MGKTKIILDCCSNHMGFDETIIEMIESAGTIGADYVKFQSFSADDLNKDWKNYDEAYAYYKSVELSIPQHKLIIDTCKNNNIEPLFTAFTMRKAEMIRGMGLNSVKIASPDAEKFELLEYCYKNFCENIFISTGMMDVQNIIKIKDKMRWHDKAKYFYCVSKYPTRESDIDFDRMVLFDGFSDHTIGIASAKRAIDLGMRYVERHFTLNRLQKGKDHFLSSELAEFKELIEHRNHVEQCNNYKTRWNNG